MDDRQRLIELVMEYPQFAVKIRTILLQTEQQTMSVGSFEGYLE